MEDIMNLKQKARELKNKIAALFLALKKKETPIYAKIAVAVTICYALSPIDLIPDFIPVLGYLDDLIILPALIALCLRLIPEDIMKICEEEAKDMWKNGKPKKWYYGLPIIIFWIIIIAVIVTIIIK
jgi:uncharacterized membrane protein YkvA (DUF1232 family)